MKRYLAFDSGCSTCTALARKICNEAGQWIDDVLPLKAQSTLDLIRRIGKSELNGPAIIESDEGSTRVYEGIRMRWRLLTGLGPRRAARIGLLVAGHLAEAIRTADSYAKLEEDAAIRNTLSHSRRKLLTRFSAVSLGVGVLTGIGFPGIASAAKRKIPVPGMVAPKWIASLDFQGASSGVSDASRERFWQAFRSSENMRNLLNAHEFDSVSEATDFRVALSSSSSPPATKFDETDSYKVYFKVSTRAASGGHFIVLMLGAGDSVLVSHQLAGALKPDQDSLRMIHRWSGERVSLFQTVFQSSISDKPRGFTITLPV